MARARFPFVYDCPVVEVVFTHADRRLTSARRLIVDTGFTGGSAFVLASEDLAILRWRPLRPTFVHGALSGTQERMFVVCTVPAASFSAAFVAIAADTSPLGLPPGIQGVAGLAFLQQFTRWGAERRPDGGWQFFLET